MKTIRFPDGTTVPALGQGTWMMAEDHARRSDEIAARRRDIDQQALCAQCSILSVAYLPKDAVAELDAIGR
ncbi:MULTISPECIES: hypothetical protein [unclassified Sphingomonas]|uniref:hypothetical protein n=1 Tax=unclassified Sphingomonas TaxID=196159 RepID=UPI002781D566|nr:hypothetical protein [Sphingomonas sp. SORGH_AS_0879]MDQ1231142.1 hypothetical protein [Sphingomonas sp. SORGH_AS_0879]